MVTGHADNQNLGRRAPKHPPPGIPRNYGRTLLQAGRTVWFMASVFAAFRNARSRFYATTRAFSLRATEATYSTASTSR